MERLLGYIEAGLKEALGEGQVLQRSSDYAVFPSGKRIRPLLSLLIAEDISGEKLNFGHTVSALELIHCSSLVHDDLPCMDNDDFRRGKPTVHRQFSEATALLTGDLLIAKAFIAISNDPQTSDTQKVELSNCLAKAYEHLCEGQELDLKNSSFEEDLLEVHALKTGALFGATFFFGAVIGGASDSAKKDLLELGGRFGVFFQLLDDYLDLFGDAEIRGRPAGSDIKNDKHTLFRNLSQQQSLELLKIKENAFFQFLLTVETKNGLSLTQTKRRIKELCVH